MVLRAKLLPFPHFSISSFLISSFPVPAFRPTLRKAGEGLDGFITWWVPRLTSCSVCSRLGLFSLLHSSFPEFSSFFVFRLTCESDCYWIRRTVRDVSRGTHHVINPSRPSPAFRTASDKSWGPGNEQATPSVRRDVLALSCMPLRSPGVKWTECGYVCRCYSHHFLKFFFWWFLSPLMEGLENATLLI